MAASDLPNFNDIVDTFLDETNEPIPVLDPAEVHAAAAEELQELADQAIDAGDYSTAAALREAAEAEADEAGDSSHLHGADSIDLGTAADAQADAQWYAQQQAEAVAEGDYEKAQELSEAAVESQQDADFFAVGGDHSGQAEAEAYQLGQAVEQEAEAEWYVDQAASWAEAGAYDTAETYLAEAAEHQAAADDHAAWGQHGSPDAVVDPTSTVEDFAVTDFSLGTDAGVIDTSAYDVGSIDTGYDATSYDSGFDSSSSYDSTSFDV